MTSNSKTKLRSTADIRQFFAENSVPYYFISATNFNLMGIADWVRGWQNINLVDCYDGHHPHVLVVDDDHSRIFESIEDINLYLLNSPAVKALLNAEKTPAQARSRVIFLLFNEHIEAACQSRQIDIALPKNAMVKAVDSKLTTTELGNQAGVFSVPNVLAKISSYANLQQLAKQADLGQRWVVQTAYGDSGKTTFFIESEADYQKVAAQIETEDTVKLMRRINCTGTAIEACATRWGTFVGPLMTELIGLKTLTPYAGGWCGNELYEAAFSADIRQQAQQKTEALGNALYQRGYRGYFEVDYLIDQDNGEVYLGELNARITGISAMTNQSYFSASHLPLFLFHLLEYEPNVELTLKADTFNQSVLAEGAVGTAAQMILKYTGEALKIVTKAPVSGVYVMGNNGGLKLKQVGHQRRAALASDEAYILRIMKTGEYAYKGGDLGILFLNRVVRTPQGQLNADGEQWVSAFRKTFQFRQLNQEERSLVEAFRQPADNKSGRN